PVERVRGAAPGRERDGEHAVVDVRRREVVQRDQAEPLVARPLEERDELVASISRGASDGGPQHRDVAVRHRDEVTERRLPYTVVVVVQRLQQQFSGLPAHALRKELDGGGPDVW